MGHYARAISEFNTALTRNHFDSGRALSTAVAGISQEQDNRTVAC